MDTTPNISVIIEFAGRVGNGGIVSEKLARNILGRLNVIIRSIDGVENHDEQGNFFYVELPYDLAMELDAADGELDVPFNGTLVQIRNEDLY